jgi:hypothetical protein
MFMQSAGEWMLPPIKNIWAASGKLCLGSSYHDVLKGSIASIPKLWENISVSPWNNDIGSSDNMTLKRCVYWDLCGDKSYTDITLLRHAMPSFQPTPEIRKAVGVLS